MKIPLVVADFYCQPNILCLLKMHGSMYFTQIEYLMLDDHAIFSDAFNGFCYRFLLCLLKQTRFGIGIKCFHCKGNYPICFIDSFGLESVIYVGGLGQW